MATPEVTTSLPVADHGLDGGTASELASDGAEDAGFCPEMTTGCGVLWPGYPLFT